MSSGHVNFCDSQPTTRGCFQFFFFFQQLMLR
jgi:hypothetical protein